MTSLRKLRLWLDFAEHIAECVREGRTRVALAELELLRESIQIQIAVQSEPEGKEAN